MKKGHILIMGFLLIFAALIIRNKEMVISADTVGIIILFALLSVLLVNVIAIWAADFIEWIFKQFFN